MSNRRCVTSSESSTMGGHGGHRWKETQIGGMKWERETGRGSGEKGDRQETWRERHSPRHSWARRHVGLSHGIWLEIRVLSVSSKQKIGHILIDTATAWHSFTVEHNTYYRTWRHSFKENYSARKVCNRKPPVTLFVYSDVNVITYGWWRLVPV